MPLSLAPFPPMPLLYPPTGYHQSYPFPAQFVAASTNPVPLHISKPLPMQTFGAKNYPQLSVVFWRGVFFNLLQCVPLCGLLLLAPTLLEATGRSADFIAELRYYLLHIMPLLFI